MGRIRTEKNVRWWFYDRIGSGVYVTRWVCPSLFYLFIRDTGLGDVETFVDVSVSLDLMDGFLVQLLKE